MIYLRSVHVAWLCVWIAASLCAGCASPQVKQLADQWPETLPPQAMITSVPFVAQSDHECGPATLSMVLKFYGKEVALNQLVDQVYLPERQGSLQVEMQSAPRRHDMVSYVLEPKLSALLQEIAAGHPVIVFQNLSLPLYPVWHYAVVLGYDKNQDTVVLHSGETPNQSMSFYTFEQVWARGHYWAMVLLPPEVLPASLAEDKVAAAIAHVERVNPATALTAYQRALIVWQDDPILLLGAGNAAYNLGKKETAVVTYQTLVEKHPEFADAWHNLAQARFELGQYALAADAINRAIKLGGVHLAQYQDLAVKIRSAK
ncbi:MAG: PA2778 family cysteine peptidase [Proteobacteria bacterium]|nr:PA2778 family cysteine peptidase [Pseudomonadota bacterium]